MIKLLKNGKDRQDFSKKLTGTVLTINKRTKKN